MSCCSCLKAVLSNCGSSITVNTGLLPGDTYKWIITDKFGNKYSNEAIANYLGALTILLSDLPAGFFTQFSGSFDLKVEKDGAPQPMLISQYFECVEIEIAGGTEIVDTIGE